MHFLSVCVRFYVVQEVVILRGQEDRDAQKVPGRLHGRGHSTDGHLPDGGTYTHCFFSNAPQPPFVAPLRLER